MDRRFSFKAGDYVFINIPTISRYYVFAFHMLMLLFIKANCRFEWHPFTISSAPELKDTFSLHIRAAGGWTKALHNYASNQNNKWNQIIRNVITRTNTNKVAAIETERKKKISGVLIFESHQK